jgi:lipopolysaccharide transport system ATP-binding protein
MLESSVSGERIVGEVVISVSYVCKTYKLYPSHQDRLKEALHPFRKRYHEEFSALHDVSFEIRRGESVGILGRNGAGKSTLLQLIAGVLNPTSGTVRVAGTISALLELGAGFNPDLTGRENVVLANTIQGADKNEIVERVSLVEAFADVGLFFDQPMKVYSSGMYARVAFAHAITVNPDVLIVDEILGVGDAKFQEKCYSRIRAMREAGVCILFVSHSTEIVQRNCDKALLIEGGKLIVNDYADVVIAAYHDLLYGSGLAEEAEKVAMLSLNEGRHLLNESGQALSAEATQFLEWDGEPLCNNFHYYNSDERRFGNGEAEISDMLVVADGKYNFGLLSGTELITIYLKVKFKHSIDSPQVGWAIVSPEGIIISGSNSVSRDVTLPAAEAGEIWTYSISLQTRLSGGEYFINVGVSCFDGQSWTFLDNRRSVLHLSVARSERSSGFIDLPSTCSVIKGYR